MPLLLAAGIEANRDRDASAKQISDGSVGRGDKSRTNSDKTAANSETLDSRSNGRESVYGRSNGSENTAKEAGFPITANKYGGFSETPASFDARFDETVTIADLKARREIAFALRQLFEMHSEARNQTARQMAEVLYLWTDLGYEPDSADVQAALTKVDG